MAVDMFLLLDDITGETQDSEHKDVGMDILAWSWGSSQSGTTHMGGGSGSGKVNVQDISITKYIDKASTPLLQYLTLGKHIPAGSLIVRKAGGEQEDYVLIEMTDIIVTSLSTGGSGGEDRLTENVTLNFAEYNFTYSLQNTEGAVEAQTPFGYDIAANTEA